MDLVKKEDYPKCPNCGADMKVVKGRFGTFLACTKFKETGCNGRAADPNREYYIQKKKNKDSEGVN